MWDAISAIAAVFGALVALWAVVYAYKSFSEIREQNRGLAEQVKLAKDANERDSQRWKAELARQEEEQARAVSVWTEIIKNTDSRSSDADCAPENLSINLHNGSLAGVRDVAVAMDLGTADRPIIYYAIPIQKFLPQTLEKPKKLILSADKRKAWERWCTKHNRRKDYEPRAETIFTDHFGRRWLQEVSGALSKIDCQCLFPSWWLKQNGKPLDNSCTCPDSRVLNKLSS